MLILSKKYTILKSVIGTVAVIQIKHRGIMSVEKLYVTISVTRSTVKMRVIVMV